MTLKAIPQEVVKICKEYNRMGIFSFLINLHIFTSRNMRRSRNFFRGGPTSTTFIFLVDEGREDSNITKSGSSSARHQNAIYMAFRWRADGGPLGSFVALLVIQTSISKKHYSVGGGGPDPLLPSGSAHEKLTIKTKLTFYWGIIRIHNVPVISPGATIVNKNSSMVVTTCCSKLACFN